jgi:hypothetical protein
MAGGPNMAVAAELRLGFQVSEALANYHFFFCECILKSHCFQLLLWRKHGCKGLLVNLLCGRLRHIWLLNQI